MKTIIHPIKFLLVFLLMAVCPLPSLIAQQKEKDQQKDKKNGTVHIRIEKEENGEKKVYERTYQEGELPDARGEALIDLLPDSLRDEFDLNVWDDDFKKGKGPRDKFFYFQPGEQNKGKRHSFYFNDGAIDSLVENQRDWVEKFKLDDDFPGQYFEFHSPELNLPLEPLQDFKLPTIPFQPFSFPGFRFGQDKFEFSDKDYDLQELKTDKGKKYIITRKKRPEEEKPGAENTSTSARQLRVEPGSSNGVFDLRFYVPAAGEVLITVTDTQGKEVLRDRIKNASGSIDRTLDLRKQEAGVYFVTVMQNKDGVTKRIILR